MKPQTIYYKVMAKNRRPVLVEKHESKRLAYWINRAMRDKNLILVRVVLVETGYNRYIYHYERIFL